MAFLKKSTLKKPLYTDVPCLYLCTVYFQYLIQENKVPIPRYGQIHSSTTLFWNLVPKSFQFIVFGLVDPKIYLKIASKSFYLKFTIIYHLKQDKFGQNLILCHKFNLFRTNGINFGQKIVCVQAYEFKSQIPYCLDIYIPWNKSHSRL